MTSHSTLQILVITTVISVGLSKCKQSERRALSMGYEIWQSCFFLPLFVLLESLMWWIWADFIKSLKMTTFPLPNLCIHWKKISPALYPRFTSLYSSRQCYWKNRRKQCWSKECLQWGWTVNDTHCLLRKKVVPARESLKVTLSLWCWLMNTSLFFKDVMSTLILNGRYISNLHSS